MQSDSDVTILDDAGLLRRVHPTQIVEDKNINGFRASSGAFKDPEMSVDVEPILAAAGLDWRFSLRNHPGHSLVRLKAGSARALGQAVVHAPEPDNRAHAEVRGKKSSGTANSLLKASSPVIIVPPSRTS